MKRVALMFNLMSLFVLVSYGQGPAIEWQKNYGGSTADNMSYCSETSDRGYVLIGEVLSNNGDVTNNHGDYDYWVVKTDSNGVLQWQKCYGGTNIDYGKCIKQTTDGGYILCGYSRSNDGDVTLNKGYFDAWILKISSTGVIQWQKNFGGSGSDYAIEINETSDGGYVFVGQTDSNDGDVVGKKGSVDMWVVKLNPSGNLQWQKCIGGTDADFGTSFVELNDSSFVIGGRTISNDIDFSLNKGMHDFCLVKVSRLGNVLWTKTFGGNADDQAWSIIQSSDKGFVLAGTSTSTNGDITVNYGSQDMWVIKTDSLGNLQWEKSFGNTSTDYAISVVSTFDGGYLLHGAGALNGGMINNNHGGIDYWAVKITSSSIIQWQKCYGGSLNELPRNAFQTSRGDFILCGSTTSTNGDVTNLKGGTDFWVVKLDAAVGINELKEENVEIIVYPNPSNGKFNLQIDIEIKKAEVEIYNSIGQKVFSQPISKGDNSINTKNLANGIYNYVILKDKQQFSKGKLVIE